MTPCEQLVELIVRMSVFVEAEFPEPHVLEWTLRVFPGHQPVWTGEADDQQQAWREGEDGAVV